MKTRAAFPEYIDSTMRSSFVSCHRKFYNEYILNRRGGDQGPSVHLVAGKAFASGIEAARMAYWREGQTPEQAIVAGIEALLGAYSEPERHEDHNKNLPRMMEALVAYFDNWGWAEDNFIPYQRPSGDPAVEFGFAIPLEGTIHPTTGAPIIYCGRCDMLAVHRDTGDIYAVDEKTTSQLGASWPQQWKHRGQLTGYVWAGRQCGIDVKGALVRGISILKTKFGFAESLQLRSQHYIDRWEQQIREDIKAMIHCWQTGNWGYNFSESCTAYNSVCMYSDSCTSSDPEAYVLANFNHHRWNPLKHQVEELDDNDIVIRVVE